MAYYKDHFLFNKFVKTTAIDALFYFVIYIYISFLSPYLTTIGWSETMKGYFFSLFSFVGIFAAPILGTLSDKLGRYKIIIIGLFLEIGALIGYITIKSVPFLFAIRIISALAFNAVTVTAISRINDTVEDNTKRSRINGVFQSIVSVSVLAAPLIGGFVADNYGYTTVFSVALVALVVIMLGLLLFDTIFYDDNRPHKATRKVKKKDFNPWSDVKHMLSYVKLRKIATIGAIVNFTSPLMILVIPFVIITKMGLSNTHLSIAVFIMGAGHILQLFAGRIADKIGKRKSIVIGLTIISLGFTGMFLVPTFELLILLIFIKSVGAALLNISMWSYMSDIAEANDIEGKVVGSYSAISRISITISFAIGGTLLTILGTKIFLVYAVFAFIPVILFSKLLLQRKNILKSRKVKI